jgi:hypothetical protein
METVNEGLDMYYYSLREIPEGLKDVGFRAVKAFDIRERFFHIEFFKVKVSGSSPKVSDRGVEAPDSSPKVSDRGVEVPDCSPKVSDRGVEAPDCSPKVSDRGVGWVALELNMRPPGGLTMDMFNYANDIDLYQQWANVVVSNSFTAKYTRRYYCGYAGRKEHRDYRLSHAEVLQKYANFISHHEAISGVMAPAIGDYGYVVRARDRAVLLDVIQGILAAPEEG